MNSSSLVLLASALAPAILMASTALLLLAPGVRRGPVWQPFRALAAIALLCALATLYAAVYVALLLFGAWLLFRRKALNL